MKDDSNEIFIMVIIQSNAYEYNLLFHQLSIDTKQTYDTITREKLQKTMKSLGMLEKTKRIRNSSK